MANYLGALRLYGISGLETATINSLDSVIEELYLAKDYSTLLKASVMREGLSNNDSFSLFDEVWEVSSMKNNNLHRISLGLGRAEKIITIAEQQKNNGQEIDIEKVKVQVGKNLSYAEGQLDKLSSNNLKAYYYLNKSRMLLLQEKSFEETDEFKNLLSNSIRSNNHLLTYMCLEFLYQINNSTNNLDEQIVLLLKKSIILDHMKKNNMIIEEEFHEKHLNIDSRLKELVKESDINLKEKVSTIKIKIILFSVHSNIMLSEQEINSKMAYFESLNL
ncbi:hypothetical protein JCM19236_3079 [Vibrio sp. JCM 19236]|nr:hypothetical protein JCM19236_3079 [Vibrio sp. JCM 19236]